jgi:hypothetical protein
VQAGIDLGRPGVDRCADRCDPEAATRGMTACGHPRYDLALHRDLLRRRWAANVPRGTLRSPGHPT